MGGLWPARSSLIPHMFGPLVLLTSLALIAQGSWELFSRNQPIGAVLIAIGCLVGSVGVTVASYVSEIERRRKGRGGR